MKKIFTLFLSLICFAPLATKMASPQPGGAMLPMPSQEEMQEIQKFLDTLSEDELNELAKIGEEIIQTAEKEGRPLFGPTPATQPMPKPQPAKPINTAPQVKPTEQAKPKERTLSSKEKSRIQRILSGLVDAIASIRQKATSDETLLQLLAPLNTSLNDITYYLNVVNYSKHLVHLTDKEFTPLNDNLRKLYEQVEEIDSDLDVPEIEMDKKQSSDEIKKQRYKVEKAAKILQKFVSIIETAMKQKHVMTDLERLVKKYEPEALKIKKEQQAKEKKASAQRTSLPVTNIPQTYKASTGGSKATQQYTRYSGSHPQSYSSPGYPRSSNQRTSLPGSKSTPAGQTPAKTSTPGTKTGTSNATQKDKKNETSKTVTPAKLTELEKTQGLEQKIRQKMASINHYTGSHNDKLIDLFDTYLPDTAGAVINDLSENYTNVLENISFELSKIKKDVTSWVTKVKNQETGVDVFNKQRKQLKNYMDHSMREVNAFHQKVKSNPSLLTGTSPRVVAHREHINQVSKHVEDIKKSLTKVE